MPANSRPRDAALRFAAGLWFLIVHMAGCSPFDAHRHDLAGLHAAGRYDLAEVSLTDPENVRRYGEKNELLLHLDRGSVALALGKPAEALVSFHEAERLMDRRRSETFLESLGVLLINDRQSPYLGEPYEDMYVNVLKMAAHFGAGDIQGGATVEARRMAIKANLLRDEYLRLKPATQRSAPPELNLDRLPAQLGGHVAVNEQGEFIESPLGVFLTAVAYMASGDPSNQAVAGRRLVQAIELQRPYIGPVDAAPFQDLETLPRGAVNAMVIAFSGRGPLKSAFPIGPLLIFDTPVYVEIPVLHWTPSEVASVRVVVEQEETVSQPETHLIAPLHLIEDMASVAHENHRRQLPLTYTRSIIRAAAKSVGMTFATQAVRRNTRSDGAALATTLGGLLFLMLTERADLRSWTFLPGQAHVGLLSLEPGVRLMRIEYLSSGGSVIHASPWREVSIDERAELTTLIEHSWR